ncbi:Crp/Fnr family transcriptional regulator [Hansschlegelia zhihuaiae]|uniref:Crp/Fnr family transcriptional regulator n=1 Tax=Hansschlegelia zhihuaiae TaxID=405005 RepID=A0A4V1KJI5_9HYPH|nr:Crp/Fnr family transcriptional regulator [Hansschlegelia zhihuaiae]RXF74312.1 Crp/Fnr family transcriptional regulator [Hansschlegelia zhihuaiae]
MQRRTLDVTVDGRPSALTAADLGLAGAEPRAFALPRGARLFARGDALSTAHLITDGLVAMIARTPGGGSAEAGLIGPGGLVGHTVSFGAEYATADALALTAVRGLALEASALVALAQERPRLRRELDDYALARFTEAERLCACSALHMVEQRLARWLLQAARLLGDRPIEITHNQFAELLGVRRASVTTGLHMLEGEQAVRCQRGRIEIRDAARLEAASCGCHS